MIALIYIANGLIWGALLTILLGPGPLIAFGVVLGLGLLDLILNEGRVVRWNESFRNRYR